MPDMANSRREFIKSAATPLAVPQSLPSSNGAFRESGFAPDSHDRKALAEIIDDYPRDELFVGHLQGVRSEREAIEHSEETWS